MHDAVIRQLVKATELELANANRASGLRERVRAVAGACASAQRRRRDGVRRARAAGSHRGTTGGGASTRVQYFKALHDRELASGRNELNGVAAAQSQRNRCTPVRVHVCSNDCARPRAVPAVTTHSLTHSATLCGHCRAHVHCAAARAHGRARQAHEGACAPPRACACGSRAQEWVEAHRWPGLPAATVRTRPHSRARCGYSVYRPNRADALDAYRAVGSPLRQCR